MTLVREGSLEDLPWIEKIFLQHKKILGNFFWLRQSVASGKGLLLVVDSKGFVHYTKRRDGVFVIREIAVDKDLGRSGIGSLLLDQVPRPTFLKTDVSNEASNKFYLKKGFTKMACVPNKGGKFMYFYQRW